MISEEFSVVSISSLPSMHRGLWWTENMVIQYLSQLPHWKDSPYAMWLQCHHRWQERLERSILSFISIAICCTGIGFILKLPTYVLNIYRKWRAQYRGWQDPYTLPHRLERYIWILGELASTLWFLQKHKDVLSTCFNYIPGIPTKQHCQALNFWPSFKWQNLGKMKTGCILLLCHQNFYCGSRSLMGTWCCYKMEIVIW